MPATAFSPSSKVPSTSTRASSTAPTRSGLTTIPGSRRTTWCSSAATAWPWRPSAPLANRKCSMISARRTASPPSSNRSPRSSAPSRNRRQNRRVLANAGPKSPAEAGLGPGPSGLFLFHRCGSGPLCRHRLEDIRHDAAGAEVFEFHGRIEPATYGEANGPAVIGGRGDLERPARSERGGSRDVVTLRAVEPERRGVLAGHELERQDAHPDQVAPMDALDAFEDDRPYAEQADALGGPVARRPHAVIPAGDDHERRAFFGVARSGIID